MLDHTGKARYYPPVHAEPVPISPRYLPEDERILTGDLLAAGHSQRAVAAQLHWSPSTISREALTAERIPARLRIRRSSDLDSASGSTDCGT